MLPILLLCFFISSTLSLFNVSVTVLDPICLDFYYNGTGTNRYDTQSQLQLECHVAHGVMQSDSYYFVTAFEPYSIHSHLNFVKNDNTVPTIISHPLVLGAQIHLSAVSPYDNFTLNFDINPIVRWTGGSTIDLKCLDNERKHSHTVVLCTTLDAITTTRHQEKITIDLSGVPFDLLTSLISNENESLFILEYITSSTMIGYTTPGQNKTQDEAEGSDKLVVPLAIVAVIAVLELIVVIGAAVFILRKIRPNDFDRPLKKVESSTVYYDAGVPKSNREGPTAAPESIEYYTEMDDVNEEYARVTKPSRNQKTHDQNNFADNAIYGH